jgi:hypothetical protein
MLSHWSRSTYASGAMGATSTPCEHMKQLRESLSTRFASTARHSRHRKALFLLMRASPQHTCRQGGEMEHT